MDSKEILPGEAAYQALKKAACVSVALSVIKFAAFALSGSVIVLASFFDSISDSIVSLINAFVQRYARKSADREHPFGHGGFEVLSSLIQGILIGFFGVALGIEAADRLMKGSTDELKVAGFGWAIGILCLSAVGGLIIRSMFKVQMRKAAQKERSLAIITDQAHYTGDAWVNLLSALGLAAVWYSGWTPLDAVLGIVGGGVLIFSSYQVLRKCFRDILHGEADPGLQRQIFDIAVRCDARIKSIHRMRTREHGPILFVDFHMTLPRAMILEEAHLLGEQVTAAIRAEIPRADVLIHLDPDSEPIDEIWDPSFRSSLPKPSAP